MRGLALLLVAACNGQVGTLSVSLVTAPGSPVLDNASELRVIVTNPHAVTTVMRSSGGGFDLSLDLPATNDYGAILVDALDANADVVATGASPPFPFGAIDAKVAIYMAPPLSIAASPVTLAPAQAGVAAGPLQYGAIFAGGSDATGAPLDVVSIYNAYDHSLSAGLALPAPRADLALGVGANNVVYLFGGTDAAGAAQSSFWRFDTRSSPNGSYSDFGDKAGFARAGQLALPIGNDQFVLTGSPAAELAGLDGSVSSLTQIASLPAAGASVVGKDGTDTVIFAGAMGVVRLHAGTFDTLDAGDHTGASAVALPGGSVLVACGAGSALVVDPDAGTTSPAPIASAASCALAATTRHVVAIDGTTAAVYATDLTPVVTIPLPTPRTGAVAIALPNDQVLIAGGGTTALDLFTPDPTE